MIREERIMNGVKDHWADAQKNGQKPQFTLGIFLQGSQNYCLDYEDSDIDTKLIVLPTFKNIIHNDSPISTTFVRENDEHTDYKDVRLYVKNFMKQNINFLEILFTNFCIVNKRFEEDWLGLRLNREKIAHYNRFRALKAMKGMTLEKYAALEYPYPTKVEVLDKYGFDPKQLHHILRLNDFISRYTQEESFADCLIPTNLEFLIEVKKGNVYDLDRAREVAKEVVADTVEIADKFCELLPDRGDSEVDELFDEFLCNVMKESLSLEFNNSTVQKYIDQGIIYDF